MSETYSKGDRVKVTIEGVVGWPIGSTDGYLTVYDTDDRYLGDAVGFRDAVTIEKLPDPLPTAPGSLIRRKVSNGYTVRFLADDGRWHSPDSTTTGASVNSLYSGYEVVFDAGKDDGNDLGD